MRGFIAFVLAVLVVLYLMGYNVGDVGKLYGVVTSAVSMERGSLQAGPTIADSFERAVVASASSTAFLIRTSGTYFAIVGGTSYTIVGSSAVLVYREGGAMTTSVTVFPVDFKRMNVVDALLSYYHESPSGTGFTCPGEMFFLRDCPGPVSYTVAGSMTLFYLGDEVTVTVWG